MALMRRANGGNAAGMGTCSQPVDQLGTDRPAPIAAVGRSDRARLAGDDQQQPRAHRNRLGQPGIEPGVGGIQRVAVQVQRQIRRYLRLGQLALP